MRRSMQRGASILKALCQPKFAAKSQEEMLQAVESIH